MPLSMDNRNRMICLFDCYGGLLTDKQKRLFDLYFNEDLSLAEISDLLGISRQAVHHSISRGEESLEEMEKTLGMLARSEAVDAVLDEAISAIQDALVSGAWPQERFETLLAHLRKTRKADE